MLKVVLLQTLLLSGIPETGVVPMERGEFDRRVAAERVILRTYLGHLDGLADIDSKLSDALLRDRVHSYVQKSAALERFWATPVTREMLLAEWRRIVRNTHFPERLSEMVSALGRDPVVILECFVRPILVDRLARNFFEFDREIHREAREEAERLRIDLQSGALQLEDWHPARIVSMALSDDLEADGNGGSIASIDALGGPGITPQQTVARTDRSSLREKAGEFQVRTSGMGNRSVIYRFKKKSWDSWWSEIRRSLDPVDLQPAARGDETLVLPTTMVMDPCADDDLWNNGSMDVPAEIGRWHVAVWTGTHMLVWGTYQVGHALLYDPLTDTWSKSTETNAPNWRQLATAIWTGSEMIVWGGSDAANYYNTGGRYDPVADVWTPTSVVNAPSTRQRHTAVWTGNRMIVWGGYGGTSVNSGGQYDPATDTWSATSTVNAPSARNNHIAVWTGTEMIAWGALSANNTGGRYDPVADQWVPTSTVGVPQTQGTEAGVWTGLQMIIWGRNSSGQGTGGRYDPATDTWAPVSTAGAPFGVFRAEAVWTGDDMVVWGGHFAGLPSGTNTGGRYDPVADVWAQTSLVNAPHARYDHTAVWTGTHMVVWGGVSFEDGVTPLGTGGRYDPASDTWTPTSGTNNGPTDRGSHTAVWTGTHMIVWGGNDEVPLNTGGLYDPMTDDWTPTTLVGAPDGRRLHTSVWTGTRMLVWGGTDNYNLPGSVLDSGASFDPLLNQWEAMPVVAAPAPRSDHTALWTGDRMLIWGGLGAGGPRGDGAAYDPNSDAWQAISSAGAPSPRYLHSSVWTGSRLIVWGGNTGGGAVAGDGGLYDPIANAWTPTSAVGAPSARRSSSYVWTGDEMIVWGGRTSCCTTSTGARYDPGADTWSSMAIISLGGGPAVWTGDLMVLWGGTGGRYSPVNNRWEPITSIDAPAPRNNHSAVWTGESMIVWGGLVSGTQDYATGGRYSVVPGPDLDGDGFHDCVVDCDDSDSVTYPGAVQICGDVLNNDCSHPSWPSLAGTNEGDDDGDLVTECQGDCADSSSAVWSTPGEARDLSLSIDTVSLAWLPPVAPGATSVQYDTLRSSLRSDFTMSTSCVESNDSSDISAIDSAVPAMGTIFCYLIRAENNCPFDLGVGPLGFNSGGTLIVGRACP